MPFNIINKKNNNNLNLLINLYTSFLSQGPLGTSIKKDKTNEFVLFLKASSRKIN